MNSFVVIFDIDGLMLDTERMAIAAWNRALAMRGYALDHDSFMRLVGLTVEDTGRALEEMLGPAFPTQEMFAARNAFYKEDIETNGIPVKPGLLELLDFLEANQVTKAVASSTPCWFAPVKLASARLDQRFEVMVCGDMVTRGKPAPDLFLEAARRINIAPERCVVLEDSEVGIIAAHNARMLPLMVPDIKQPGPEIRALAYRVLPTLREVIPLVADFLENGLPESKPE